MPLGVHIAGSQGSTHGDTQHGIIVHAHSTCKGGHFTVVHHFKGNFLAHALGPAVLERTEHATDDILEILRGDTAEEGTHARLAVHIHTSGRTTDGIHLGQVLGGAQQGIIHTLKLVHGVGLVVGIPHHFFREHNLTVHHSGALAVGTTQVETDAVAVQVAAQGHGGAVFSGQLSGRCHLHHLNGLVINLLTDEVPVELAGTTGAVGSSQHVSNLVIASHHDGAAALHPEQELDDTLDVLVVQGNVFAFLGQNLAAPAEAGSIQAGQRQVHSVRTGSSSHLFSKSLGPKHRSHEGRVEHGSEFRLNIHSVTGRVYPISRAVTSSKNSFGGICPVYSSKSGSSAPSAKSS